MKIRSWIRGGLCLLAASSLSAGERPLLRTYVEYIELPHAKFAEIVAQPGSEASAGSLHAVLRELVKEKKAHIRESVIVTGLSGDVVALHSVQERIYPTGEIPSLTITLRARPR